MINRIILGKSYLFQGQIVKVLKHKKAFTPFVPSMVKVEDQKGFTNEHLAHYFRLNAEAIK